MILFPYAMFHGKTETKLLAAMSGGIYKTADGTNWAPVDGISGNIPSIYQDGSTFYAAHPTAGVYKSTDAGSNWTACANGLSGYGLYGTSICKLETYLVLGAYHGIWISADNAANWSAQGTGLSSAGYVHVVSEYDYDFYVGGAQFYISTDSASTFSYCGGSPLSTYQINGIAINGTDMLVATQNNGVWKSSNGTTFTDTSNELSTTGNSLNMLIHNIYYVNGVWYACTGAGLWKSTNTGGTWTNIGNSTKGLTASDCKCFYTNGTSLFVGTVAGSGGGIYTSTDNGDSWSYLGLSSYTVNCIVPY